MNIILSSILYFTYIQINDIYNRPNKMSPSAPLRRMIDIAANLTDPMFRGIYRSSQKHIDDFEHMLDRAKKTGIAKIIVTGTDLIESREALKLSQAHSDLYSTVGCHPTNCTKFDEHSAGSDNYLQELLEVARTNRENVVALGEIGLDYDRLHFCDKETQKKYFEKQLMLNSELRLPLFLHNRASSDDLIEILRRNRDKFNLRGGVVHSFDGNLNDLTRILDLGLHIGINGCSLKTDDNLDVVKHIPSDKLLIETDCPWCEIKQTHSSFDHVQSKYTKSKNASNPLVPVKGRNEPMQLVQVLEALASIRQEDIEVLCEKIYDNTTKLFFDCGN